MDLGPSVKTNGNCTLWFVEALPIHHGNMAVGYTPLQLYTMVGEGVVHSQWQYIYMLYTTATVHQGRGSRVPIHHGNTALNYTPR